MICRRDVGLEWHVDKKFFEDFENKDICLDNGVSLSTLSVIFLLGLCPLEYLQF